MQSIVHVLGAGAETAGKNIGEILGVIGAYVLLAIVGWAALSLLPGRQFGKLIGLFVMAFVIGGLFVAGDEIWDIIEGTWQRIARGT